MIDLLVTRLTNLYVSTEKACLSITPEEHQQIQQTVDSIWKRDVPRGAVELRTKKGYLGEFGFLHLLNESEFPVRVRGAGFAIKRHDWELDNEHGDTLTIEVKKQLIESTDLLRLSNMRRQEFYIHHKKLDYLLTWALTEDQDYITPLLLFNARVFSLKRYIMPLDKDNELGCIPGSCLKELEDAELVTVLNESYRDNYK